MTERVKKYLEFHLSRSYRQNRKDVDFSLEKYKNLDENLYAAEVFSACAESEELPKSAAKRRSNSFIIIYIY